MRSKEHFSRFLAKHPQRLHFCAHSHHPWPDVSFEAHQQAWLDAAELMDAKWDKVFDQIAPTGQDELGMQRMFKQFSFPGHIGSHVTPETPGPIRRPPLNDALLRATALARRSGPIVSGCG